MRKFVLSLSFLAAACVSAMADPVADRQALMKERAGALGKLAPIAKGEQPFDAAAVKAQLDILHENAMKGTVAELFPEGTDSEQNAKSEASPKIWADMAAFNTAWDKYNGDVMAAASAPPQDIAAFKAQFGAIASNCGGCHQDFRVKKN